MRVRGVVSLAAGLVSVVTLLSGETLAASAPTRTAEPIFAMRSLSLDAWRNGTSLCFRYDALGAAGHGCTPLATTVPLNVLWVRVGRNQSLMFGTTTEKTRRIFVRLPNDDRVAGQLRVAPNSMRTAIEFFAIYVSNQTPVRPAQTTLTVLAYGADGRLVGRARIP